MIIDGDGHFFETEEIFDKHMEPGLRNYRPRLLGDKQGHNFWVIDGQTSYQRRKFRGPAHRGPPLPPGKAFAIWGGARFPGQPKTMDQTLKKRS